MPLKQLLELWTRLTCVTSVTAVLVIALSVLSDIDGLMAYHTGRGICAEIGARVAIALGLAAATGTAVWVLALPYIFWRPATMPARLETVTRLYVLVAFNVCGSAILGIVIRWGVAVGLLPITNLTSIAVWGYLTALLLLGTFACYFVIRRDAWTNRLVQSASGRTTRRLLLFASVGGLITGLSNGSDRRPRAARPAAPRSARRAPNILMVTFDALSAEDVSCFGYRLPTTPNIDVLAQSSYVFQNCYASSTFTTPSTVSMLTGRYPSSTRVYHFGGPLRGTAGKDTAQPLACGRLRYGSLGRQPWGTSGLPGLR